MDNAKTIRLLNAAIADELQVIQQFMYWHFHLANRGFGAFSSQLRQIAIQEMGHLEALADRILSLQGEVEMVAAAPVMKITEPGAILDKAVQMVSDGIAALNEAAVECSADANSSSKQLFEQMVKDKEAHQNQFEKQRDHIRQFGSNYSLLDRETPGPTGDGMMKILLALDSSKYSEPQRMQ